MLCSPVIAQDPPKKNNHSLSPTTIYSIKPTKVIDAFGKPVFDKEGKPKFEVKADEAIKVLCGFAEIKNYSIDSEVMDIPGKYINLSTTDLSFMTEMLLRSFGLEINKIIFEDGTTFYEFRKKKIIIDIKK